MSRQCSSKMSGATSALPMPAPPVSMPGFTPLFPPRRCPGEGFGVCAIRPTAKTTAATAPSIFALVIELSSALNRASRQRVGHHVVFGWGAEEAAAVGADDNILLAVAAHISC